MCALKKHCLKQIYVNSISLINSSVGSVSDLHRLLLVKDLSWFYLEQALVQVLVRVLEQVPVQDFEQDLEQVLPLSCGIIYN